MSKRTPQALYIAGWHDLFEPTYRRGGKVCYYHSSPGWFREVIHTGEKRRRLFDRYGLTAALQCIAVFDQLRQFAGAKPIEQRGWIVDSFGKPLSMDETAHVLFTMWRFRSREAQKTEKDEKKRSVRATLQLLVRARWIVKAKYCPVRDLPTLPGPKTCGDNRAPDCRDTVRTVSGHCRDTVGTLCAPIADSRQAEQIGDRREEQAERGRCPDWRPDDRLPGSTAGGPAALPALPAGVSPEDTDEAMRALTAAGFGLVKARELWEASDFDVQRITDACEAAIVLKATGKLKSKRPTGYILRFIERRYELPRELLAQRRKTGE